MVCDHYSHAPPMIIIIIINPFISFTVHGTAIPYCHVIETKMLCTHHPNKDEQQRFWIAMKHAPLGLF